MAKTIMYQFTFSKPVEFKRVYNFLSPFAPTNNFWIPYESSKHFLASTFYVMPNNFKNSAISFF